MKTQIWKILNLGFRQDLNIVSRNYSSAYKSSLSLSSLYPNSSLDLSTRVEPPRNDGEFSGFIPIEKLDISYSRSSGPGGQNVNKVSSKVDVRFHLSSADWLPENAKTSLASKFQGRLNKDGFFIVRSEKTRSQFLNQADAITSLREMIFAALEASKVQEPSQETLHQLRKRRERANMERLAQKKLHSQKKYLRQAPDL